MKDVLFRGKRIDNFEWVEGYFVSYEDETYIFQQDQVNYGIDLGGYLDCCKMNEVVSSTVGQYTGLTDKNGTKIFEGDIVKIDGKDYEVKYMLGQFFVGINMPIAYKRFDCEVIGNIHDNPELLTTK